MEKRLKNLFLLMTEEKYHTAEELAGKLKVSSKTVRNLLKELDGELEKHGAGIHSKYGAGYAIEVKKQTDFDLFKNNLEIPAAEDFFPSTSEERVQYLLEYLFNSTSYVKCDDLSESLFICKRTLTADIKEAERFLNKYNLKLVRKPNYGMKVEGKEFDLRLCIAAASGRRFHKGNESMDRIAVCISEALREFDYAVSSVAFQNLIVHIYVAISRIMENHYVPLPEMHQEEMRGSLEYRVAKDIIARIDKAFSITFPESEIAYVAIHLAGKMLTKPMEEGKNLVITQEISDLVAEMLKLVYDAFKFDFRDDLELIMALSQHIVPLQVRLEYDMSMKNPLLKDIKEKFCLAYTMASQAATVINRRYHTMMSEDEVGYIALAFALALERKKTEIVKKNVLLVCASGRGSAQLLLYKYKSAFGPYINKIEACDVGNLYKVDFKEIDYVITTVPIPIPVPVPIQEVQYFLQAEDIANVKRVLGSTPGVSVKSYYEEELFLPHLNCKDKKSALKAMCQFMQNKKHLPEAFYDSVMEREQLAKTAFGNMVAMPHPYKAMSEETFVCVAILDEPVDWGDQDVQVIFLVSIGGQNQTSVEMQNFYQVTAAFLLSQKRIQELIKKRDYKKFLAALEKTEAEVGDKL